MPAIPYDAKGILKSAIRDDDPVIVIENKALHALKGPSQKKNIWSLLGKLMSKEKGQM